MATNPIKNAQPRVKEETADARERCMQELSDEQSVRVSSSFDMSVLAVPFPLRRQGAPVSERLGQQEADAAEFDIEPIKFVPRNPEF